MKITLTGKLSNALKKTGSNQKTLSVEKTIQIYRNGLKKTDWDNLEKEDKEKTGKYLSGHTILPGDNISMELEAFSKQVELSPGEIFRTALWKGLRHSTNIGGNLTFSSREKPITQ